MADPANTGGKTGAASPGGAKTADGKPTPPASFWDFVIQTAAGLAPVIVSGAGLAALVVGVGGAVTTARFYAAGLPPAQAVNAATDTDMQAIGLTWLVTFGLVGLFAVLLAYIASPKGRATAPMYYALIGIAMVEALVVWLLATFDASDEPHGDDWKALAVVLGAALVACLIVLRRHIRAINNPQREKPGPGTMPRFIWDRLVGKTKDSEKKEGERLLALTFVDYLVLGIVSVIAAAGAGLWLGHWWVALSVATAGALGLLTIRVAALNPHGHERFRWYGVCVFFSVGIFGAALGVFRMLDEPRLQPVAFLVTEGERVTAMNGVYVGESDDRLWFASVALNECGDDRVRRGSGRLRSVPAKTVSHMTIGPPVGLPRLAHEAEAMLDDVIAERNGREVEVGPGAVRDSIAIGELDPTRVEAGRWVTVGSAEDLGEHPRLTLGGRPLRARKANFEGEPDQVQWAVRLGRRATSGPIYVECGERTNRALVTVPRHPFAVATAFAEGGSWRLDARGSVDVDGQIEKYVWKVGDATYRGRTVTPSASIEARVATLVITDGQGLVDKRDVPLRGVVARTYPSDILFQFDKRRMSSGRAKRVRALRHDATTARRVRIVAHTDERGSKAHNLALSRARAKAVGTALLGKRRLERIGKTVAKGESLVIEPRAHRRNRRIAVIIY